MATKRKTKTATPKQAAKKSATAARKSKQRRLIEMLQRPQGATIEQMAEALGWQPHTVRGTLSGALKKRLGLAITSTREKDRDRVYRISGTAGGQPA